MTFGPSTKVLRTVVTVLVKKVPRDQISFTKYRSKLKRSPIMGRNGTLVRSRYTRGLKSRVPRTSTQRFCTTEGNFIVVSYITNPMFHK